MSTSPLRYPVGRWIPIAGLALLAACATAGPRMTTERGLIAADDATAEMLGAPRVSISTEYDYSAFRRVRTRLRVQDDAYVLVVNVQPEGTARIIFPESPADSGLLRGGKSYLLPGFFGGYPSLTLETSTSSTRFVTVSRSMLANATVQGPGYTFVLSSRWPFDMRHLEEAGYFDWVDLQGTVFDMNPDAVVPMVADVAFGGGKRYIASMDVARYAGYDLVAGQRAAFAYARGDMYAYCSTEERLSWSYATAGLIAGRCDHMRLNPFLQRGQVVPRPTIPPGTPPDSIGTTPDSVDRTPGKPGARPPGKIPIHPVDPSTTSDVMLNRATRQRMLAEETERRSTPDALSRRARSGSGSEAGIPTQRTRRVSSEVQDPRSVRTTRATPRSEDAPRPRPTPRSSDDAASRPAPSGSSGSASPAPQPSSGTSGSTSPRERPQIHPSGR